MKWIIAILLGIDIAQVVLIQKYHRLCNEYRQLIQGLKGNWTQPKTATITLISERKTGRRNGSCPPPSIN